MISSQLFDTWYAALETRHLRSLTFQEVRRALQALSSLYVERRAGTDVRRALDTAGKRAAFALFYAPLHLLQISYVIDRLKLSELPLRSVTDLGCGTGSGGAAWSLELGGVPRLMGVDVNPWVLEEARWNYQALGIAGETRKADLRDLPLPTTGGILLAFTANELDEPSRERLLRRVLHRGAVLAVEPVARRVAPWWERWAVSFESRGGRADEWRFSPAIPERLQLLDKAAALDHRELKCRSLWLPPA
jgi:hypothetical protein